MQFLLVTNSSDRFAARVKGSRLKHVFFAANRNGDSAKALVVFTRVYSKGRPDRKACSSCFANFAKESVDHLTVFAGQLSRNTRCAMSPALLPPSSPHRGCFITLHANRS